MRVSLQYGLYLQNGLCFTRMKFRQAAAAAVEAAVKRIVKQMEPFLVFLIGVEQAAAAQAVNFPVIGVDDIFRHIGHILFEFAEPGVDGRR